MDFAKVNQHCLDLLQNYLRSFVLNALMKEYGSNYTLYLPNQNSSQNHMSDTYQTSNMNQYQDALYFLNLFQKNWNVLSKNFNSNYPLSLVHSLRYFRNRIAHQASLTLRQVYQFVDSTQTLLEEMNVGQNEYNNLDFIRKELMKIMINCNDNIVVFGKKEYNNFCDLDTEMVVEEQSHPTQLTTAELLQNQKIEANYEKIIKGSDSKSFYKVTSLEGEGDI